MPGSARALSVLGERAAVDPRRADLLERLIGAAPDRDVRVFDRPDPRIERRLIEIAHVRRRIDPRQPGLVEPEVAAPIRRWHDGQRGADLLLAVEQLRQLAERHAVAHRHRREVRDERRSPAAGGPSICQPLIGFGRSSTTTAILRLAASSIT